ncbi:unnamed protein product [Cyclocybe aegerita]|uniref:Uncharacterized protein n=1 Tax=Cyclocybe aegerita TaxID=1973307 RepID=A0A8S0VW88_CYCAE|nr:unnamed protein product [Cyclocybe aegerita]
MTEVAEHTHHDKNEGVVNGAVGKAPEKAIPVDVEGDEGALNGGEERGEEVDFEEERQIVGDEDEDEDDEYEVEEEEEGGGTYEPEGEEEEEEVQDHRGTNTLTHLLLGNPNAPADDDDVDDVDDEDDEVDENDDEDDDDDYVDNPAPPAVVEAPEPISRKRSIQEVVEDDADDAEPQGSKKVKA